MKVSDVSWYQMFHINQMLFVDVCKGLARLEVEHVVLCRVLSMWLPVLCYN
jgi:hypothetical protein